MVLNVTTAASRAERTRQSQVARKPAHTAAIATPTPSADAFSPEMQTVVDVMLADIDRRLAEVQREADELLAHYNLV